MHTKNIKVMGKEMTESLSSFICYNCNEKNFFDTAKYINKNEGELTSELRTTGHKVKEVTIECKSCRESNSVKVEY
jgi:hypothetical protein